MVQYKSRGHLGGDETFFIVPGAPRACADFGDPTAVSRMIGGALPRNSHLFKRMACSEDNTATRKFWAKTVQFKK